jgi:hypothetical protein
MIPRFNASNWRWTGAPQGYASPITYSSASGGLVSLAPLGVGVTPWPRDAAGAVTVAALDEELTRVGLPPTKLLAEGASLGAVSAAAAQRILQARGCAIASNLTPALNGVYSMDPAAQQLITYEAGYIQVANKFTNGQATRNWTDAVGGLHTFTTAQFITFAEAMAQQVDIIRTALQANPVTVPGNGQTIP